jgi:hypothetical protein
MPEVTYEVGRGGQDLLIEQLEPRGGGKRFPPPPTTAGLIFRQYEAKTLSLKRPADYLLRPLHLEGIRIDNRYFLVMSVFV